MLDERKAAILRAVVEEHIETAQPVGSAHVARAARLRVSSATVRNEMALLEREGYLAQPHTSAGRIPTDKGYRFFVDQLTEPGHLGAGQTQQVREFFARAHGELEQMLHDTSRLLSNLTQYAGVVVGPPHEVATIRAVQVVSLGPRVALLVAVLSNGVVERRTVELDDDAGEERVAAATAHLGAHPLAIGAEHVVAAAALRVAQRLVGDRDLLEALLGHRIAMTRVGVQLARQLAIGALDLVLGRARSHAEQLVVVSHPAQPSDSARPRRRLTTATAASACG